MVNLVELEMSAVQVVIGLGSAHCYFGFVSTDHTFDRSAFYVRICLTI